MNHLKMRYVDLNVQFLKVEQSKVRKREFYEKPSVKRKRNQKLHVNVNSNN